jgi:hypothetical protein
MTCSTKEEGGERRACLSLMSINRRPFCSSGSAMPLQGSPVGGGFDRRARITMAVLAPATRAIGNVAFKAPHRVGKANGHKC